nr:hypothetical protein Ccrd_016809 [Ipomoea batatas]
MILDAPAILAPRLTARPTAPNPKTATAEDTNFVKRCMWVDLGNRTNMTNGIFAEGGSSNEVIDWLAVDCKS